MRAPLTAVLLALALSGCSPDAAKAPEGMVATERVSLPARPLRGYGELAGDLAVFKSPGGGECSLLSIQCEDEGKAKIVHAKFVGDLHALLPVKDVSLQVAGLQVPVVEVPDQGVVAAFRTGRRVEVATGTDVVALRRLLAPRGDVLAEAELVPNGKVPMFMDSWDKHGFRFYYRPGETPPLKTGEKPLRWKDYDVLGEFDFAKRNGGRGFVFWANEDQCDFAEGLDNRREWEFAARACANRSLPVVVNTCAVSPTWLVNRFRDQTQWKMPGYCGAYHGVCKASFAGNRQLAWSADEGLDASLAVMRNIWRDFAAQPNTIEYLEPHGELRHGNYDLLNEYGPQADKSFREFLKTTYGDLGRVSRRWFGASGELKSWDDVRVPELASFLGYSPAALDLDGDWRYHFEAFKDGKAPPTTPAPEAWYLPSLDDQAWPTVAASSSDVQMFLPRRPAVWRRHFTVPPTWLAGKKRIWLYAFPLNRADKEVCPVYLNGERIAAPVVDRLSREPMIAEVDKFLRPGENLLALRLPENFLGYRVYLSDQAPAKYPFLGEGRDARWADFIHWHAWIRKDTLRRSFEALREVDTERSVVCMAPEDFTGEVEELCQDYGGHFHNTGYMAGWWAEPLPMMMRAADMPFSAEPGNPGHNLAEFKSGIGHWLTEGVNAIHYFIHVGDIYWNDEIRQWFESNQAIIGAFGKMHVPKAEVAMLLDDDVKNLTGWPWGDQSSGYVPHQFNVQMHKEFHMDAVSTGDFGRGLAAPYRVVLDTNTCVMDARTVDAIEAWVKAGGVFVAIGETGRHTPEKADSWPISRLTGYRTLEITKHPRWQDIHFAPGQTFFKPASWSQPELKSVGRHLAPLDASCVPIALWPDGAVAIGMRKLGAGMVVDVGCNINKPKLLPQLLDALGLKRIPGYCDNDKIVSTHEVSNNGLYDLWILWNREQVEHTGSLVFRDGLQPPGCVDLKTQEKLRPDAGKLANLKLGPGDIRILASPRPRMAMAPLDWLNLQRGWWRGTKQPSKNLPPNKPRFSLDLGEGWLMKPLDDKDATDHAALAAADYDDSNWTESRLKTWLLPEDIQTHRLFFRKRFSVPATWKDGEIALWLRSWIGDAAVGRVRLWLDGMEIPATKDAVDVTAKLTPGKEHLLALELVGDGRQVVGFRGNLWLAYIPKPNATVDLAGPWLASPDGLTWEEKPLALPGPLGKKFAMLKRTVKIAAPATPQTVMFWMDAPGLVDVIVNGHYVRRHHHRIGSRASLDITPWIKFGEPNEFVIPCGAANPGVGVKDISLRLYTPGAYP